MSFSFPKCWSNDETMNFRFQCFNDRTSNPLAYDTKMNFWKDLIIEISRSSILSKRAGRDGVLAITHRMLCDAFTRKGRTPKCLGTVLEELQKDKLLTEYETYHHGLEDMVRRKQASWTSWGYDVMLVSPIKKLISVVSPRKVGSDSSRYVVNENVKQTGLRLLELVCHQADSGCVGANYRLILSHKNLLQLSQTDKEDLDLLLLWLESEKYVKRVTNEAAGTLYKFSHSRSEEVQSLTEVEQGVLQIQITKEKLETTVKHRQQQVKQCILDGKKHLANKNRTLALRAVRKKKSLEKSIAQEEQHIDKLECILDEIYMSSTSQLVVNACGKGAAALKFLTDSCPIEKVNDTMDELSETLMSSADINEAISTPLPAADADSESLEQELIDLLREESPNSKRLNNVASYIDALSVEDSVLEDRGVKYSRVKALAS